MAIIAGATVGLSILIQRVSGPALWLPSEWRNLLLVIVPLICTGVLTPTIRVIISVAFPQAASHGPEAHAPPATAESAASHADAAGATKPDDPPASTKRPRSLSVNQRLTCHLIALLLAATSIFCVSRLLLLRGQCVRSFQSTTNLAAEFDRARPPFFLDLAESQILTPEQWPPAMQDYFRRIETDRNTPDGLAWMLDYAPYEIVQSLQSSPGKELLQSTVWHFVMWYLAFVTTLTGALVFVMNPAEFVIEEILGRLVGH